jgi:hypothetical protein
VVAVLCIASGCTPRPLVERAIRARGGPLSGLVIRANALVHTSAPETWEYRRAFLAPDHYAWTIVTLTEPIHFLFDGMTVRTFIGEADVSNDGSPYAPLRTHARWTALVNLDALTGPGVTVTALPREALPAGVHEGLEAVFADGARFRLGFDDRTLLIWAQGPLDLSPLAAGEVSARFGDYRRTGALLLPFSTTYALGPLPLADETVLAACVDPPALTAASFTDPAALPTCP